MLAAEIIMRWFWLQWGRLEGKGNPHSGGGGVGREGRVEHSEVLLDNELPPRGPLLHRDVLNQGPGLREPGGSEVNYLGAELGAS